MWAQTVLVKQSCVFYTDEKRGNRSVFGTDARRNHLLFFRVIELPLHRVRTALGCLRHSASSAVMERINEFPWERAVFVWEKKKDLWIYLQSCSKPGSGFRHSLLVGATSLNRARPPEIVTHNIVGKWVSPVVPMLLTHWLGSAIPGGTRTALMTECSHLPHPTGASFPQKHSKALSPISSGPPTERISPVSQKKRYRSGIASQGNTFLLVVSPTASFSGHLTARGML